VGTAEVGGLKRRLVFLGVQHPTTDAGTPGFMTPDRTPAWWPGNPLASGAANPAARRGLLREASDRALCYVTPERVPDMVAWRYQPDGAAVS
jgi:hypothetical protein